MDDWTPLDTFDLLLTRWWMITILIIIGGLIGLLVSRSNPPVYEARASILITSNSSETKNENQTSSELSDAAALISARALGPGLIAGLDTHGIQISSEDMQLERRESNWDMVVRSSNPQLAVDLANAWLDSAYATMLQASTTNQELVELIDQLYLLNICKRDLLQEQCDGYTNVDNVKAKINSINQRINAIKPNDKSVIVNISFFINSYATVPKKPVAYGSGVLILSGALSGLLIGLLFFMFFPRKQA